MDAQTKKLLTDYWKQSDKVNSDNSLSMLSEFKDSIKKYYFLLSKQQVFTQREKVLFTSLKFNCSTIFTLKCLE